MTQVERYAHIQAKITQARTDDNRKALKLWRTKLEAWQLEYGAYAPIGHTGKVTQL